MDTSKLKSGQTIKNYKELCTILNIPVTGGDAKKKNLKELSRFCRYTQAEIGNRITIQEVYTSVLPKAVRRTRSNNIWLDDILFVLLDYLARSIGDRDKVYSVILSTRELITLVGLCSEVFFSKRTVSNRTDSSIADKEFFKYTSEQLRNAIRSTKRSLQSRHIAVVEDIYVYRTNDDLMERQAGLKDHTRIDAIYGRCLDDATIDCKDQFTVFKRGKSTLYYNLVKRVLITELGFRGVKQKVKFSFTGEMVERLERMKQNLDDTTKARLATNSKIISLTTAQLEKFEKLLMFPLSNKAELIEEYRDNIESCLTLSNNVL